MIGHLKDTFPSIIQDSIDITSLPSIRLNQQLEASAKPGPPNNHLQ